MTFSALKTNHEAQIVVKDHLSAELVYGIADTKCMGMAGTELTAVSIA